ncbi:hypothetical protein BT96DRAFT_944158 [Gymnopus androsaceus JB14]|uniref:Uncharacterized protein n=1 Tax=Gymnopus androsaceus JB14 TaxID=1447944 RepID=A0A6A4H7I9_9AGAR|nr:hypothetical protein BT96DRAFT_944158 [Gymnopus androsaceus JB14]
MKLEHNEVCGFWFMNPLSDLQLALELEPQSAMSFRRSTTARSRSNKTVLPYDQSSRKEVSRAAQKALTERTSAAGKKLRQPLTTRSTYKPLNPLPLSIIPTPVVHFDDIWPDDPFYFNDTVDDTSLPSWGYVEDLSADDRIAMDDYFRFLLPLARYRDPEIANWVLKRMDFELEALARLPHVDCPAFEGDYSPDRKELCLWLLKHDKDGLHAIHQNTIALLRSVIDDIPEYEISKHGELFGDKLRIIHMDRCMSEEAKQRRQAYLAERVRDAKA